MTTDSLSTHVSVRELIGWDLDENEFRPASAIQSSRIESARGHRSQPPRFQTTNPVGADTPVSVAALLKEQLLREDLHRENGGARLVLRCCGSSSSTCLSEAAHVRPGVPAASRTGLRRVARSHRARFRPTCFDCLHDALEHLRETGLPIGESKYTTQASSNRGPGPFEFHGGSPFFEVAEHHGRWFLRDGYHRAEYLLRSGITQVPAVVIRARTLAELGSIGSWFFSEQILFGPHPPYVSDFLDDQLTQQYARPRMLKTVRVTIEESFGPAASNPITGEQT